MVMILVLLACLVSAIGLVPLGIILLIVAFVIAEVDRESPVDKGRNR